MRLGVVIGMLTTLVIGGCGSHGRTQPCMIDQTNGTVCNTQAPTPR